MDSFPKTTRYRLDLQEERFLASRTRRTVRVGRTEAFPGGIRVNSSLIPT
jgi:hypothetical protein